MYIEITCADKMGWEFGMPPQPAEQPYWVITDDNRRCLMRNGVLVKWSVLGTKVCMWHPRTVTDDDWNKYDPPEYPKELLITKQFA